MNSFATKKTAGTTAAAGLISVIGLTFAGISVMYIAGMFGLSSSVATQIVNAVEVGGWVLAAAMALVSGGIAGTVVATAKWAISQWGKKVAIS
ncbi:uberolysin/carnocyclin family circular bacteriocin [Streptomyces sp. FIT100]|uniref:uberolysin/carnocyclin family circular bacteriocin n=1 Tax=Streptomyces sp. FIT100 TaxID=2837956 RepID=UPI0021C71038|nr:uberolysin/carnocyclin family circular bacteriocin [Streptomyces sp. FIT100]UUN27776.1 uberolysin/carnocyclin family circular bacteriocin [Streptomyces sp. FIT100]